ncbi:MAG TPA: hypothetical protein VGO81_03915 [Solirubrobacteraceae bacterium]|nr:hypothetical protein [Solirubrobacteraceae bacterium]
MSRAISNSSLTHELPGAPRARAGAAGTASLFDEIGAGPAKLPVSVTETLVALSSAHRPRRARV